MKLIRNAGTERVVDLVRPLLSKGNSLDLLTSSVSLFAFEALREGASKLSHTRLVLPYEAAELSLLGSEVDRPSRNRLQVPRLAMLLAEWLRSQAEVRRAAGGVPQGLAVVRGTSGEPLQAVHGAFGFSTDGLGLTPGNPLSFIQASESAQESEMLAQWFDTQWASLGAQPDAKSVLLAKLDELSSPRDPMGIYAAVLYHLFHADSQEMDEDRIVKAATGIHNTVVWKKLFKFQRDGVVGAIDKLDRFGGCIIADSVGLGKTFEALAVIKYHELRNDRVLVLCPKRLRDNWTLYRPTTSEIFSRQIDSITTF
ncbi:SNF2-related protein [Ottowia caeni]|uniref:SNF2-related protein n=1 Tax=Ottowia caeni TaxID=2870339 RepID=UPI003D7271A9